MTRLATLDVFGGCGFMVTFGGCSFVGMFGGCGFEYCKCSI